MGYISQINGTTDLSFNNGFAADTDFTSILINKLFFIAKPNVNSMASAYVGNILNSSLNLPIAGSLIPIIIENEKITDQLVSDIENEVELVLMSLKVDSYSSQVFRQNHKIIINITLTVDENKYKSGFIINMKNNTWLQI